MPLGERWDPGLQPERTTLAWVRTGLALTVVSLLLTRLSEGTGPAALLAGLAGLVAAEGLVIAQAGRHRRSDARLRTGGLRPALGAAAVVTVVTVALAVVALVLVAVGG